MCMSVYCRQVGSASNFVRQDRPGLKQSPPDRLLLLLIWCVPERCVRACMYVCLLFGMKGFDDAGGRVDYALLNETKMSVERDTYMLAKY